MPLKKKVGDKQGIRAERWAEAGQDEEKELISEWEEDEHLCREKWKIRSVRYNPALVKTPRWNKHLNPIQRCCGTGSQSVLSLPTPRAARPAPLLDNHSS